jgi:hypothetical protein
MNESSIFSVFGHAPKQRAHVQNGNAGDTRKLDAVNFPNARLPTA